MKAAACLWKVQGLEQRVAVIICAIRCLHLQLSCKWGKKKEKVEAAVLGLCLSLVAEGLANYFFFPLLNKSFQLIWNSIIVNKEWMYQRDCGSWNSFFSPSCCPALWGCVAGSGAAAADSCAVQLHVQKCLPPLFLLVLLTVQTWAELLPHKISCVTTDLLFPVSVKISKQKELFFFVLLGAFWFF